MRKSLLLTTMIGLLCPALTYAGNTIDTATPLALGQVQTNVMAVGEVEYYAFNANAGRSYAVACWNATDEGSLSPAFQGFRCNQSTIRNVSDMAISVSRLIGSGQEPSLANGTFMTFVASATDPLFVRLVASTSGTLRIVIIETTLFSPWYFVNASSGYEAFVEIQNTTVVSVSVTVTAYTATGTTAGSTTVTIPAKGNTALAIGSAFAITAGNGSVQIANNAPPGGVVANVTTLSGTTGLSFDSPASPRMAWSLF